VRQIRGRPALGNASLEQGQHAALLGRRQRAGEEVLWRVVIEVQRVQDERARFVHGIVGAMTEVQPRGVERAGAEADEIRSRREACENLVTIVQAESPEDMGSLS
jgi:hypothetical protein